jgi:hypothetical protein
MARCYDAVPCWIMPTWRVAYKFSEFCACLPGLLIYLFKGLLEFTHLVVADAEEVVGQGGANYGGWNYFELVR